MGNPEPNPAFRKQTKHKGSERENQIKKDRCRDSMEAVLTNGVDCDALVTESFPPERMKDKTLYICIHTEILYQMINDDSNLYFLYEK